MRRGHPRFVDNGQTLRAGWFPGFVANVKVKQNRPWATDRERIIEPSHTRMRMCDCGAHNFVGRERNRGLEVGAPVVAYAAAETCRRVASARARRRTDRRRFRLDYLAGRQSCFD